MLYPIWCENVWWLSLLAQWTEMWELDSMVSYTWIIQTAGETIPASDTDVICEQTPGPQLVQLCYTFRGSSHYPWLFLNKVPPSPSLHCFSLYFSGQTFAGNNRSSQASRKEKHTEKPKNRFSKTSHTKPLDKQVYLHCRAVFTKAAYALKLSSSFSIGT